MKQCTVSGFCLRYVTKRNTQPNSLLKNLVGFDHPKHYTSNIRVAPTYSLKKKNLELLKSLFLDINLAKTGMTVSHCIGWSSLRRCFNICRSKILISELPADVVVVLMHSIFVMRHYGEGRKCPYNVGKIIILHKVKAIYKTLMNTQ